MKLQTYILFSAYILFDADTYCRTVAEDNGNMDNNLGNY